jgi:hypothetical protein
MKKTTIDENQIITSITFSFVMPILGRSHIMQFTINDAAQRYMTTILPMKRNNPVIG